MKLATFTYTDLKGKTTSRKLMVLTEPSNKYFGVDVSELDDEQIALLFNELDLLDSQYTQSLDKILQEYDVKYNFRQFLESGVRDFKLEQI